jgi:calcineurin-like phosphoesterase family protein
MDDKKKYDFIFEDGKKIFFTSDSHANHFNIIGSCNRPFKDENEMNEALIEKWNSVVDEDSIVFHLGDFAWGGYIKWKLFRDALNGHIILIKGNHDDKNLTTTGEKEFFDFVAYQMKIRIGKRAVYLNHYPFLCYAGTYREPKDQVWALHGHIHLGPNSLSGLDVPRMEYLLPTQYDVGVDMNDFTPISWEEVKKKIEFQVENNVNCLYWTKK